MLKTGLFQTPEDIYVIYEITEQGFYRIDFVRDSGAFQTDVDKVVYSQVHKKNTFVYGDKKIYERWLDLRHRALEMKMDTNTESGWDNGVYKTHIIATHEKTGCSIEIYREMNDTISETITIDGCVLSLDTTDAIYGVKLDPVNMFEYEQLKIDKSTVSTDSPDLPYHSLETLRRMYDIEHLFKEDYVVADTIELADKRLNEIEKSNLEYLGVDTETHGLDVNMYGDDYIVGIILAQDEHTSTYFPFRMESFDNLPMSYLEKIDKVITKYIDRTVAHNSKFDRKAFLRDGLDYCFKYDTLQGSIILNPIIKKGAHELKSLVYELTGKRFLELTDIFVNPKDINFAILPKEIVRLYACPDSCNAIRLIKDQLAKIPKYQMKLFELECAMSHVVADHEYCGIRVDVKEYEKQYKNCNYVREKLLTAFRQLTHCDDNINSSQVLSELIYGKMHCQILSRTKTGNPSTSTAAINKLGSIKRESPGVLVPDITDLDGNVVIEGKKLSESKYPALLVLSEYKRYTKLITAFYARFERTLNTGRIFFWVNQNGAATGRQSSPMHQLPPALKKVILSDSEQHDMWGPDYSQIELRMIAYLSGQKDLVELCKDPDNDIHRAIGSLINNCEMWEITPEERSTGKRRNFGVVYLISKFGLAGQIFGPGASKDQIEFCEEQLNAFYHRFKRIDRYIKGNGALVKSRGYMETKWLHRRRLFPEVFDTDLEPRRLASILRMGNNVPVQGTAADYLKLALTYMYDYIRKKGWYKNFGRTNLPMVRIMLSIHDEILISADKSIPYEEVIKMITLCMEIPVEGAPPFFAQPAKLKTWEDHNNDSLPIPVRLRDKLIQDYERTGVSVINEQNYIQIIDDYRKEQIHSYMDDLIAQYGNDYRVVGEHVRHPSLSHELISLYHKEMVGFSGTQAEKITEATRYYMLSSSDAVPIIAYKEREEDREIEEELQVAYGDLEELATFDDNGELVYDDDAQDDVVDFWYTDDYDIEEVRRMAENKPEYVWELADSIIFDTSEMSTDDINDVLRYIASLAVEDGFFSTHIIYGDKMLDTGLRIERFDQVAANNYMLGKVTKVV